MATHRSVGQGMPSVNNRRLVQGGGRYVADVRLPEMAHVAVVRSDHAHAEILNVDVSRALAMEGVLDVVTGAEIVAHTDPIISSWNPVEMGAKAVEWYALCAAKVRYQGEAVAAVVAENELTAREAATRVDVTYAPLVPVLDGEAALAPDAPLIEEAWGDNVLVSRDYVTGGPDEAFADADGVVEGRVRCNRVTGAAIEGRGCVADYDRLAGKLTVWSSTQGPHPLRTAIAESLRIPETTVRVIQPDVGGAFGLKQPTFQEEVLIPYLARKHARPMRWIEERIENFLSGGHSRDTAFRYRAAYRTDGTLTALNIGVVADVGAPTALCGYGMAFVTWYCLPTLYRIPNVRLRLDAVVTNKCPWNSYRGYGKDAATFLMERVMDHVARELGYDRAEIRARNFIQPEEFPYAAPSGAVLDSGNYPAVLDKLLAMVDYDTFPQLQREARDEGRHIGLGLSMEMTPEGASVPGSLTIGGFDGTTVRVAPSGEVLALTGVTSPGSGNETAIGQLIADTLGCDVAQVTVIQGDTDACPWGLGNYSSRSVMYGGASAVEASARIRDRMVTVASRMLGCDADRVVIGDGAFCDRERPDRRIEWAEVTSLFYRHPHGEFMEGVEPALEATHHYRVANVYHQPEKQGRLSTYPTWPNGAAAAIVEVDSQTGFFWVRRYCYVHDAGLIVNPTLAEANLHGAIAQGLGGATSEEITYDATGRLQTVSFNEYRPPRAVELPPLELSHVETPSPFTVMGAKGVGESGVGATLNALCSAIEDAMGGDIWLSELPLRPERVWAAIQRARQPAARA